jgi:hypothetical protein
LIEIIEEKKMPVNSLINKEQKSDNVIQVTSMKNFARSLRR